MHTDDSDGGSVPVGAESPVVAGLARREPATLVTGL
jgi:hypothetical protein